MTVRWEPETALEDVSVGLVDHLSDAYADVLRQGPVAQYEDGYGGRLWGIMSYEEVAKAAVDYWDDPATFDIDRAQKRHMGFGRGVHMCFGAPMGRMEMKLAVEELLARTTSFSVDGEVTRKTWPRLSVEMLPLKLESSGQSVPTLTSTRSA